MWLWLAACANDREVVDVRDAGWLCVSREEGTGGDGAFGTVGVPTWIEVVVPVQGCSPMELRAQCAVLNDGPGQLTVTSFIAYRQEAGRCGTTLDIDCARPISEGTFTIRYGEIEARLDLPGDTPVCLGGPDTGS
jgi:hypothetical protein